jgi:hypothetical protein
LYDKFESNNCIFYFNDVISEAGDSKVCNETWAEISKLTGDLNWYDLYRPVYPGGLGTADVER